MQPIGLLAPDVADTNPGVARETKNVILVKDGSGVAATPMPRLTVASTATALPDPPRGAGSAVLRDGTNIVFIGTATAIYLADTNFATFTLINSGFNLPDGDNWSFEQFGDYLIASNRVDGMWEINVEAITTFSLITTAPKARFIRTVFDCLFAFGSTDDNGNYDNRLFRNSDFNNHRVWAQGVGVADSQPLADGEEIQGGVELTQDFAVVIQRDKVRLLTKRGDTLLFNMTTLENGVGAVNPQCIIGVRGVAGFVNNDGFYLATPERVIPIGADKVNKRFLSRVGLNWNRTIEGAFDPYNRLLRWRYKSSADTSEVVFTQFMDYSLALGEFVEGEDPNGLAGIFNIASPGYDADSIDGMFGDADSVPYGPDDPFWRGGEPRLGGVNGAYKIGFFNGGCLPYVLETASQNFPTDMLVNSATIIGDAADAKLSLGVRQNLFTPAVYSAPVAIQRSGRAMVRARGKNICSRITGPADSTWTYIRGIDHYDVRSGGVR